VAQAGPAIFADADLGFAALVAVIIEAVGRMRSALN
jgi:hypothetical protein